MPIQTFNFANIEPMKLGSRFSDILAGLKTSEDSEDRRIKNEGLGHQNTILGAEAQYAPDKFKFANAIQEAKARYAAEQEQADVQQKLAHAFYLNQQGNTEQAKNAPFQGQPVTLYGKKYYPNSLKSLPANEQNAVTTGMRNHLKEVNNLVDVEKEINEAEKLLNDNPDMSEDFNNILVGKDPGIITQLFRKFNGNKKGLAALTTFEKLTNNIMMKMAQEYGGQSRMTDAKMRMLQSTKASRLSPKATNAYVLNSLKKQISYAKPAKELLLKGLENQFPVYLDLEGLRDAATTGNGEQQPTNNAAPNNAQNGIVKIRFNGKTKDVPADKAKKYLSQPGYELVK